MTLILAADVLGKVMKHFGIVLVDKKLWKFIITRINVPIKKQHFLVAITIPHGATIVVDLFLQTD